MPYGSQASLAAFSQTMAVRKDFVDKNIAARTEEYRAAHNGEDPPRETLVNWGKEERRAFGAQRTRGGAAAMDRNNAARAQRKLGAKMAEGLPGRSAEDLAIIQQNAQRRQSKEYKKYTAKVNRFVKKYGILSRAEEAAGVVKTPATPTVKKPRASRKKATEGGAETPKTPKTPRAPRKKKGEASA